MLSGLSVKSVAADARLESLGFFPDCTGEQHDNIYAELPTIHKTDAERDPYRSASCQIEPEIGISGSPACDVPFARDILPTLSLAFALRANTELPLPVILRANSVCSIDAMPVTSEIQMLWEPRGVLPSTIEVKHPMPSSPLESGGATRISS